MHGRFFEPNLLVRQVTSCLLCRVLCRTDLVRRAYLTMHIGVFHVRCTLKFATEFKEMRLYYIYDVHFNDINKNYDVV
jgi:hypothetical protein